MKEKTKNKMADRIEMVLKKVRPYIQMHGGDVNLVSADEGVAVLKISGACADCRMADLTYNTMLSGLLKEEIPEIKKILLEK